MQRPTGIERIVNLPFPNSLPYFPHDVSERVTIVDRPELAAATFEETNYMGLPE